ncbi:carbonic anhydrase 2-like isoform X2 [Convolutriloba macropyga]|uniref:carbonic anhydrase 2-like isoform X2 n=2 Tax=Convolutriloba macropyga TaxID=536237 RepID=UPI003F5237CB
MCFKKTQEKVYDKVSSNHTQMGSSLKKSATKAKKSSPQEEAENPPENPTDKNRGVSFGKIEKRNDEIGVNKSFEVEPEKLLPEDEVQDKVPSSTEKKSAISSIFKRNSQEAVSEKRTVRRKRKSTSALLRKRASTAATNNKQAMSDWSHHSQNEWGQQFPISVMGTRQSPIDIRASDATKEERPPFKLELIEGDGSAEWTLTNNGHTFVAAPPQGVKWQLSGGVLEGTYVLGSFHSHWGHAKGYGCEHLLDGQKFDGETHFVFQLTPDIPTVEDKFVAYGIMMQESGQTNPKAQQFIETLGGNLDKIIESGSSTKIPGLDLTPIAEANKGKEYFAYKGSLTTPPFAEAVLHVVFTEPLEVASSVFGSLRNLTDSEGKKCTINYRAIQPLLGRKIHHCVA